MRVIIESLMIHFKIHLPKVLWCYIMFTAMDSFIKECTIGSHDYEDEND